MRSLVLLGLVMTVPVQAAPRTLTIERGTASYQSRDFLSAWTGTTDQMQGSIRFDDRTGLLLAGIVTVQLAGIDSKNGARDARMRGELQTDKFPTATFTLQTLEGFPKFSAWKQWGSRQQGKIRGDLTIRDITRPVTFDGEAVYTSRELRIKATGTIKMTDFNLTPPSLLLVTVENTVGLTFEAVALPPKNSPPLPLGN
ncbi:YceI family protein [Candidatus Cyanaurora vandensis]|uniref:YceI family protein n=1 Tax=Candidatus Cyanaurora vandensis TaxID=2714958 RepID=UPI00257F8999|nr:YceI family protein [Candidatus Cyanaurora vandensis]